jgi:threonine dehydrogenase-like Zn-dependent dehydrogenase
VKAIAVRPGVGQPALVDRPEPEVHDPDQVKARVLRVGICGTDREEVAGGRAKAPEGESQLVIGHEMLGQVVAVGTAVTSVRVGGLMAFTVRRGCGQCLPCSMGRSDMCRTGKYRERGIWGLDGYQSEFVVDSGAFAVAVPDGLDETGVLAEPLSVAEKAIDEAVRVQSERLPDAPSAPNWLHRRRCLVAGLGPIGLLAALALRVRGAEVYGLDIVEAGSARPAWLESIGGTYIDGRQVSPDRVDDRIGPMDVLFEATGVPSLAFNLLDALAADGVYVLTGIPGGDRPLQIPGAELIRQLVLDNQVMLGSVNASRGHFEMAVEDLAEGERRWPGLLGRLITHRHPWTDFAAALGGHPEDEIKAVIEWRR